MLSVGPGPSENILTTPFDYHVCNNQDLVASAQQLLLCSMDICPFARERFVSPSNLEIELHYFLGDRVLDSYLGMASDLSRSAIAVGPSPDLRLGVRRVDVGIGGVGDRGDDNAHNGTEAEENDSAAQYLSEWELEDLEQKLDEMRRDVEWM